jgi:guanine nucleotide-binding protein subunit alpha
MQEALMLFDSICNSQWFTKTSIVSRTFPMFKSGLTADNILEICLLASQILFLNKDDIFRQKIMNPKSQIAQYFPNFDGQPLDYEGGREFFRKQFTRLNRSSTKEVYTQ